MFFDQEQHLFKLADLLCNELFLTSLERFDIILSSLERFHLVLSSLERFDLLLTSLERFHSFLSSSERLYLIQVLIANNGIAAVKCMRSIRRWCYGLFGNEHAIRFVAMVTPEDLKVGFIVV